MSGTPTPINAVIGLHVLDCDEVAAELKVTSSTIKGLVRTGQLATIKVGRHQRFDIRDVQEFVDRQRDERLQK